MVHISQIMDAVLEQILVAVARQRLCAFHGQHVAKEEKQNT